MPMIDIAELEQLQKKISNVRNICILAHVDHGKTTLADSLVASNGIISKRMAGKLRYLDNRRDEQERGITMKSSSIALHYHSGTDSNDYLINMIDSPGHVDFSNEVSTAVRLCDGAIVIVDVVEGVCPQTRACMKQIYDEMLKPVLVLNKIDRLILEKKMKPLDAYLHCLQLLEQVNAVLGNLFASDILAKENITEKDNAESALQMVDDSSLYFSPEHGNVIFCSAYDGWAFSITNFVEIYADRLGMSRSDLRKTLWGNYYYNGKKKCAVAGAQEQAKKPMFVQFIFENIWTIYDIIAVRKDKIKMIEVTEKLGIKLLPHDLRINDVKTQVKVVMEQWLPIDRAVLEMVVQHIPAPNVISDERSQRLLYPSNENMHSFPMETLELKQNFKNCNEKSDKIIVFVSKMCPIHISQLPQNKLKPKTKEELEIERERVLKLIEKRKQLEEHVKIYALESGLGEIVIADPVPEEEENEYVFIAFARVFSGTIKSGMKLYNLKPKHDPRNENLSLESSNISEVTIGDLYMFMGGEVQSIAEVPAGNVVGIAGLEQDIVKTATLSNTMYCTSFSELSILATPIFRVALAPANPSDMLKFIKGLKLLNQADACVQIAIERTGEYVITTLGEMHVEKCVRDLEENYAKVKVNVSKPIVPFRETIVPEAMVDMVNEAIINASTEKNMAKKIACVQTGNKQCTIRILALPLPQSAVELLEKYETFLKDLLKTPQNSTLSDKCKTMLSLIKELLSKCLQNLDLKYCNVKTIDDDDDGGGGNDIVERIWSLGPSNVGTNILLNLTNYKHPNLWTTFARSLEFDANVDADADAEADADANGSETKDDIRRHYNSSFISGFQLTTSAGPLCEEPMQGVCFAVLEWSIDVKKDENYKTHGPLSGQILNSAREACRQAFQNRDQRLVSPMYSCNIVANTDVLGKLYAVIGRRHGKVLFSDLTEGSGNFSVSAILPVIESFNFAQEIRKQTSGLACPQLLFSHWEIIDVDPFWVPTTEEEITHFGEKADSINRAKVYMDSVRRRKGLYVEEKIIEHAEKQRTLSKNK